MRTYAVRRPNEVKFIQAALECSGFRVLEEPTPKLAPFVWVVVSPWGERLKLIVYAFRANKYKQKGRSGDEHRFQVKYGGDLSGYHEIYFPSNEREITLFLGVHFEEEILVAVDPCLHNPTRFSSSIEFKDHDVSLAKSSGWTSWERQRSATRRVRLMPEESLSTEILLGFCPENFAKYVYLEYLALGLDAGERGLLIDQVGDGRRSPYMPPEAGMLMAGEETLVYGVGGVHPLELELGLSASDLLNLVQKTFRLKVAVRGAVAEHHLLHHLRGLPELKSVERLDQDGQPDFSVSYRGKKLKVECKNVLRRKSKKVRVDFQRTRASKGNPCSRYYRPEEFEILATCLHPVSERWEFRYALTRDLPEHAKCDGHIANGVVVGEDWTSNVIEVLDRAIA